MQLQWDVIIVGAGPAGMTCAMQCVRCGLNVLVLDRHNEPGGHIWKHAATASAEKRHFFGSEYAQGTATIQDFLQCGATFVPNSLVWYVHGTHICARIQERSYYLCAKVLVLATGGMERPCPVEGWEHACVMGAGACDLLLKSAHVAPKAPIVLCGNGPLLLQSVAHLSRLHIPVAGLVLTGNTTHNMWHAMLHSLKVLGRPFYFLHGLSHTLHLILKKIPIYFHAQHVRIHSCGYTALHFKTAGKPCTLHAKTILIHEGIVPETRMSQLAQCRHIWDNKNLSWYPYTDACGESSVDNVYVTGDMAGVIGAQAALAKGHITGIAIGAKLGLYTQKERDVKAAPHKKTLLRCKLMQDFTDTLFTPNPKALLPSSKSIVCRCEELTAEELTAYMTKGCHSLDAIKGQSRCGMGFCQGRMCGASLAQLMANVHGVPLEHVAPYTARPPLFPITVGEMAHLKGC